MSTEIKLLTPTDLDPRHFLIDKDTNFVKNANLVAQVHYGTINTQKYRGESQTVDDCRLVINGPAGIIHLDIVRTAMWGNNELVAIFDDETPTPAQDILWQADDGALFEIAKGSRELYGRTDMTLNKRYVLNMLGFF